MEVIISRERDRGRWPRGEGAGMGTGALALASEVSGTESGCSRSKAQEKKVVLIPLALTCPEQN